jgi:hypothetical protein
MLTCVSPFAPLRQPEPATPGHRKKAPRRAGAMLSARVPGRSPLAAGGRSPPSVRTGPGRASLGVRHLQGDDRWHGELHVLEEQRHLAESPRWCNRELTLRAPRQTSRSAIASGPARRSTKERPREVPGGVEARRFDASERLFSLVYLAPRRVLQLVWGTEIRRGRLGMRQSHVQPPARRAA